MTSVRRTAVASLATLACLTGCSSQPPGAPDSQQPLHLSIDPRCVGSGCPVDVGSEMQFSASALYRKGTRPVDVAWTTDDAAVATVDASGRVRGVSIGATMVRATFESLTAATPVRVLAKSIGSWKGEWVVRTCKATGDFQPTWCGAGFYGIGSRFTFELHLREDSGRLSGGIAIDRSGPGLAIEEGATLDADGRLQLSARGSPEGLGWYGAFGIIAPLRAQIRGPLLEGSFVMKILYDSGIGGDGEVVLEADLDRVTLQPRTN